MSRNGLSRFWPALLLAGLTGCVPVSWLPDSSGFVYTEPSDRDENNGGSGFQLLCYDLAAAERRVLAKDMPAYTYWPALSPDGKQIAVARLIGDTKVLRMQVLFYDLQGKEVRRSPAFVWPRDEDDEGAREELQPTGVFWAQAGDRIIVHTFRVALGPLASGRTGIYDLRNNTMIFVDGQPAPFAGTPIRPDGKGFLVTNADMDVTFVDWQGKRQPVRLSEQVRDADHFNILGDTWMGISQWRGSSAILSYGASRFHIDTALGKGGFENIPEAKATAHGAKITQHFTFPGSGQRVRVIDQLGKGARLELVKAGGECKWIAGADEYHFSPSPNGRWLAVRSIHNTMVFLISQDGNVRRIRAPK